MPAGVPSRPSPSAIPEIELALKYSENEIAMLIGERKSLPRNWHTQVRLRPKQGHRERDLDITGVDGNQFRLILHQSMINHLDFSVILATRVAQSSLVFRLLRYNGKSHRHTNSIEGNTFYDYHIHRATERYQEGGAREDAYAETTDRYSDFAGALNCMWNDGNFNPPPDNQPILL